jgi:hypothetical protein|tara:strand:- start:375 stop:590 length:216 start_codon:yes stop_codon:yes gene_type:complete
MVEIKKNNTEIIRIKQSEFKGNKFIDCRVFYEKDGEYLPTKKGIAFSPSVTKKVVEGILEVHEEINWDEFK